MTGAGTGAGKRWASRARAVQPCPAQPALSPERLAAPRGSSSLCSAKPATVSPMATVSTLCRSPGDTQSQACCRNCEWERFFLLQTHPPARAMGYLHLALQSTAPLLCPDPGSWENINQGFAVCVRVRQKLHKAQAHPLAVAALAGFGFPSR